MRYEHCILTPTTVRTEARNLFLLANSWTAFGTLVTVPKLLDLLLLMAVLKRSLFALVRSFHFGFSHETARQAVHANLPATDVLTQRLLDALYFFQSRAGRRFRAHPWTVAIDTHNAPFYGDRATPGIIGGQKKHGTQYFYGYATAVLIHRRARYVVGLLALTGSHKPQHIVEILLNQCRDRGLRINGVVMDSGFDSADVVLNVQRRGLSYVLPMRRKGKGDNARNRIFQQPVGTRAEVTWQADKSRCWVTTATVVVKRRRDKEVKVFAYGGWTAEAGRAQVDSATVAAAGYRRRFGIETSYRQLNETKGRTTAKDVAYRLLLVGIALLLRQVWVYLSARIAQAAGYGPAAWVAELPLQTLRSWLESALRQDYNERQEIDLRHLPSKCKLLRAG